MSMFSSELYVSWLILERFLHLKDICCSNIGDIFFIWDRGHTM